MYDPVMRVLTVLEILQARDTVSGSELAERLEVNLRTVQRYITRLRDLCIPVESVRGVDGFYRLKPGFRLPPLMLTDEEAFAAMLGLRGLRLLGLTAFAPAAEGASAKLARVLPESLRNSVRNVEEVVAVEPGPWVVSTSAESLIRVATAIRQHRRLTFRYKARDGKPSRREIEPYGVAHVGGRWYVVGYCLMRKAKRTFRLDRVTEPEIAEEAFDGPPVGFDVREHLTQTGVQPDSAVFAVDVWVALPLDEVRAKFWLGQVALEAEGGGTRIQCRRDTLDIVAISLVSLGCRIEVRGPDELREALTVLARRAAEAAGYNLQS
jgi:predicted DNA-binding transcriptional regulator YafY